MARLKTSFVHTVPFAIILGYQLDTTEGAIWKLDGGLVTGMSDDHAAEHCERKIDKLVKVHVSNVALVDIRSS